MESALAEAEITGFINDNIIGTDSDNWTNWNNSTNIIPVTNSDE